LYCIRSLHFLWFGLYTGLFKYYMMPILPCACFCSAQSPWHGSEYHLLFHCVRCSFLVFSMWSTIGCG
jgi:hypothetical protein